MPAAHRSRSRIAAAGFSFAFVPVAAGAALAQSPAPFAPPTTIEAFTLHAAAALADVNRDGSLDVVHPGLFFGTYATSLDEDGALLCANVPGPSLAATAGAPTLPLPVALAGGDLDGDGREDLVTVTACGSVRVHRNLGSARLDACHFAAEVVIDQFLARFPIQPPMVTYSFPVAKVLDFDGDGRQDVLVAGGPVDRWNGATRPGFVGLYCGQPGGGFAVARHAVAGAVVDLAVADLDRDGRDDHLVVLTETGAAGAFTYDLLHLVCANGELIASAPPRNLGTGRCTALAVADVVGDGHPDYVLAQTTPVTGGTLGQVHWFQGDGACGFAPGAAGALALPPNPTLLGDFVASLVAGDWNGDGATDLALLRGFVAPGSGYPGGNAVHADSELLVAMGPAATTAACTTIALPGYHLFSATHTPYFAALPLQAAPGFLRTLDLGRDSTVDLLVTGMRCTNAASAPTRFATLRNTSPPVPGRAGFARIGAPSGGAPGRPARLGFEGGPPRPGNRDFACTLLNVQGGSLCGLVWGPLAMPNLFTTHGIDVHLVPAEFGRVAIAAGSLPGEGFHREPLPIPDDPALLGDVGCFQYAYYDPVCGALGGSHATHVRVGR